MESKQISTIAFLWMCEYFLAKILHDIIYEESVKKYIYENSCISLELTFDSVIIFKYTHGYSDDPGHLLWLPFIGDVPSWYKYCGMFRLSYIKFPI